MPKTMPPLIWLLAVFSLSRLPMSNAPTQRADAHLARILVHAHLAELRAERVHGKFLLFFLVGSLESGLRLEARHPGAGQDRGVALALRRVALERQAAVGWPPRPSGPRRAAAN